jgi:hypothetical protein
MNFKHINMRIALVCVFVVASFSSFSQNSSKEVSGSGIMKDSIFNPFRLAIDKGLLTVEELEKLAPNYPRYHFTGSFKASNREYFLSLQKWAEQHPQEILKLESIKEFIQQSIERDATVFMEGIENVKSGAKNTEVSTSVKNEQLNKGLGLVTDFSEEYLKNISAVAPNMPSRPNRADKFETEQESMAHRISMNKWAREFPDEFRKAVLLDAYINIFRPDGRSVSDKKDPWPFPEFMRYKVSELKPELQSSGDSERDKRHFENQTQHWYFLYNKEEYVKIYGSLPVISTDYPLPKK